jgi:hypothetical protein
MRLQILCAGLFALAASLADAAPAAPVVTVGANDIKQLQFDWTPVPTTNTYELWFRANPGASWVKYAQTPAQRPYFRIGIPVHLLDFAAARYYVKACNPSGCSASTEIGVDGLANDAMGYIKPRGVGNNQWFGNHVALSADGATLAVLTGETLGIHTRSAVVHVYRRTSRTSAWRREARLIPSTVQSYTVDLNGGAPLALSADGSRLALGVFREDAPGIPDPADTGAVYLFRRDGGTWTLEKKIAPAVPHQSDWFGYAIDLDDAGGTLAVLRQDATSPPWFSSTEIYRRGTDNTWSLGENLPPPAGVAGQTPSCESFSLSGNGLRLFRTCGVNGPASKFVQVLEAPVASAGWRESARLGTISTFIVDSNLDGTRFIASAGYGTDIWVLTSAGWSIDANGSLGTSGCIAQNCAISRDGKLAVVGRSSSALVFERKFAGWFPRGAVVPGSANAQAFGRSVAFGDNGRTLAVGAPLDPSAATGIDGDRDDQTAPERGAVWLY